MGGQYNYVIKGRERENQIDGEWGKASPKA
jgi:hypothetical protein